MRSDVGESGAEADETDKGYTDDEVPDCWVDTESRMLALGVKQDSRKKAEGGELGAATTSGNVEARSGAFTWKCERFEGVVGA